MADLHWVLCLQMNWGSLLLCPVRSLYDDLPWLLHRSRAAESCAAGQLLVGTDQKRVGERVGFGVLDSVSWLGLNLVLQGGHNLTFYWTDFNCSGLGTFDRTDFLPNSGTGFGVMNLYRLNLGHCLVLNLLSFYLVVMLRLADIVDIMTGPSCLILLLYMSMVLILLLVLILSPLTVSRVVVLLI